MRAVVLAAGRGSRLGPATRDRPKCLVELAGRTLLQRQVAALRAGGVNEVGVVTGWAADRFVGWPWPRFHNPDWATDTMVGSLAAAHTWLATGPVLVAYGDVVFDAATVRALTTAQGPLALVYDPNWLPVWQARFSDPTDDAENFRLDAAGELAEIGGRARDVTAVQGQFIGLFRTTPPGWATIRRARQDPAVAALDTTGLLAHLLGARLLTVTAVPTVGPWWEFDHPSDIAPGMAVLSALDAR